MTKGARESPLCFFKYFRKNANFAERQRPAFMKSSKKDDDLPQGLTYN